MLDAVGSALGGTVPWVGGSASAFNEQSWGTQTNDAWTQALVPQLGNADQTVQQALQNATDTDAFGPHGNPVLEHPETGSANGGDGIDLRDPNAMSYHAILLGGDAEQRHLNDLNSMRGVLTSAWGTGANVTIDELVGPTANLQNLTNCSSTYRSIPTRNSCFMPPTMTARI